MIIRKANKNDIDKIIEMGRDIHSQQKCVGYNYTFSEEAIKKEFDYALSTDKEFVYIVEHKDKVVGILWAYITTFKFSNDLLLDEALWHVSSELNGKTRVRIIKALFKLYEELGMINNVDCIFVSSPVVFQTEKFLTKAGYSLHENIYRKVR